jgi:hypothetical protein
VRAAAQAGSALNFGVYGNCQEALDIGDDEYFPMRIVPPHSGWADRPSSVP